ncbi:hypothetical protein PVK06_042126 [Gossypium arboreum]|uniref:Reverse transcriptase n=1 Tax=Gossypium arboreum TaxID=29729 RepID=A0ABR0MJS6_GOSAR|nr:hypothetical protein PVK06_042126 [Gossypium arboreum]
MVVSRWLCEADGSQYKTVNLESPNQSILLNDEKDTRQLLGKNMGNQMSYPILNQLGSNQQIIPNVKSQRSNWSKGGTHTNELEYGPMELVSKEENDPIAALEGKKRQCIVEGPLVIAGGRLRSARQMMNFWTVLEDCSFNDLRFIGRWFTWERGRFGFTNIRERLNHGVATLDWVDLFPGYQVQHLSHSFSDHCPILLDTMRVSRNDRHYNSMMFRFEAKWYLENSFEEMVKTW